MSGDHEKQAAARRSLEFVEDGMRLGLGTGSTAKHMVDFLGERVRTGLSVRCVATSEATAQQALACGIDVTTLDELHQLDLTIDGADEVDAQLRLIKGGGGALLREKIVAAASDRMIVIADGSKYVEKLGAFPLPVEVIPFALEPVRTAISPLGCQPVQRTDKDGRPFRTDEGNFILDCPFRQIDDPDALATALGAIPGVVEHGLFVGLASMVLIGRGEAVEAYG
ncbi:MAG: ribose-5-phosphate isomerase RpiA [Planctomycetota bacterium]